MLRATLAIDTSSEEKLKESARMVKLILYIVDRVASLRLSQHAKAKADKNRREVEKLR